MAFRKVLLLCLQKAPIGCCPDPLKFNSQPQTIFLIINFSIILTYMFKSKDGPITFCSPIKLCNYALVIFATYSLCSSNPSSFYDSNVRWTVQIIITVTRWSKARTAMKLSKSRILSSNPTTDMDIRERISVLCWPVRVEALRGAYPLSKESYQILWGFIILEANSKRTQAGGSN
jgi:hypothetical protein